MSNYRYPFITGGTDHEKLSQVQSFLHQLVDQLNQAQQKVDKQTRDAVSLASGVQKNVSETAKESAKATFTELKSLIIKSAEVVETYKEEVSKKLSEEYLAKSEFGTYLQSTELVVDATAKGITQHFTDIQAILDSVEDQMRNTSGHIRTGILCYADADGNEYPELEDGTPVIGVEVGQTSLADDGSSVFKAFARFTASRLTFYDGNGHELAYISGEKLYITHAEILGTLTHGSFEKSIVADGIVTRWIGG